MKKVFYSVVLILILTLFCTNVGAEQFGDVFFEYDDGIRVFLSGGQGTPDSFGVALSDGDKILHIYHIGSDFEKPVSFIFHGFSDKEIEVRQFVSNDGVFSYGLPFYVTYDGKLNVISLNEIKESVKSDLENLIDKSLYRLEEQAIIDSVIEEARFKIDGYTRRYGIESVIEETSIKFSALKTDAEYKAEELAEKRVSAIDEIHNYVNKTDYRAEEQAEIDSIISNATIEINTTEEFSVIDSVVAETKNQLSALKTDAEYKAEELTAKRASAIDEINNYADKSNYRDNEQTQLENIITNAVFAINSATEIAEIDSIIATAKVSISALKTDAEYKAEELAEKRVSAIDEIINYTDKSNYRENEQNQIERIIAEATLEIDSTEDFAVIDSVVENAKASISTLKTDAEYKAEELAAKRASAIDEIHNYVNKTDYRTEEQNQIDSIILNANSEINSTEDFDAIDLVIANAKVQLSALKTDAEYKAEELAVKRTSAIDDINNYADKNNYRDNEQTQLENIITNAVFAINSATEIAEIDSIIATAKVSISALKTDAEYKAEELAAKRASAIYEIHNYVNKADYRAEEQAEIDSIISDAISAINSTEDFTVIDSLVESAKVSISVLKTDAEYKAEELAVKRTSAIDEINNYADKNNYRDDEQTQLENIITNAVFAINSATEIAEIDSIIATAKVSISTLKTDAEYKSEELAAKRASAIYEIHNYVNKTDYRTEEQEQIDSVISDAISAINSTEDFVAIDSVVENAKASISTLKTDAEYKAEELVAKRISAIDEINNYVNKADYRTEEQAQIDSIISNATTEINTTEEFSVIDSVVASVKNQISALKTDAEYKAEELTEKRVSAINEITNYVNKTDYRAEEQAQIDSIISNTTTEINATEDFAEIDSVVEKAKASISTLKTDTEYKAEELAVKRTSAIDEINNYVDKSNYRDNEQTQLENIITNAVSAINSATEIAEIDSIIATVKVSISALKTDVEYKAEELVAKRISAIDEINNYVNKADYRAEEQAEIDSIISDAISAINSTEDFAVIDSVVESAKASISTFKTDAEYKAEELTAKRISAINEITNFVDKSNYRTNEQNQIDSIISNATIEINTTEDFSVIDSVVASVKNQISALKTDAEYKAEELAVKRTSAIDEINNYADKNNYRDDEQTQLENIISNAVSAINSATEIAEIDSIIATAKISISVLKTDAEYKVEELAAKRASAIDEINNYVNKADYRTEEQNQIDSIILNANSEINSTEDFDAIDLVIANAKVQLSALKTDAEYKAEELVEKRTSAIDDITYFVDKSAYREQEQAQINSIISNAITRINISEDIDEIDSVVASAKNQLSALKTDAELTEEELLSSKSEAEAEITGFVDLAEYRESEAELITEIITKYTHLINSAETEDEINIYLETAKSEMSAVLTDSQLKDNADANAIVLTNLNDAITQLGKIRFFGNEKKIMNIILPVMKQVVADGTYGSILITPEYVEKTYASQIAEVKSLYDSMDETIEKPGFEAKLAKMDPATQAFLKEYFL